MELIHLIAGATGKSLVAVLLSQYLSRRGKRPVGFDADPMNAAFASYEALDVTAIDPRRDNALEAVLSARGAEPVVVDGGPWAQELWPLLRHGGVLHCVLTAQQDEATVGRLLGDVRDAIVWLNPVFGPLQHRGAYDRYADQIAAIVTLPSFNPQTFGRDLRDLLRSRRTFAEAQLDASLWLLSRQRLKQIERAFYQAIDACHVL